MERKAEWAAVMIAAVSLAFSYAAYDLSKSDFERRSPEMVCEAYSNNTHVSLEVANLGTLPAWKQKTILIGEISIELSEITNETRFCGPRTIPLDFPNLEQNVTIEPEECISTEGSSISFIYNRSKKVPNSILLSGDSLSEVRENGILEKVHKIRIDYLYQAGEDVEEASESCPVQTTPNISLNAASRR